MLSKRTQKICFFKSILVVSMKVNALSSSNRDTSALFVLNWVYWLYPTVIRFLAFCFCFVLGFFCLVLFFTTLTFFCFLYSGPPEITKPKTVTRTAIAGESVYVSCHANGSPSPQYVWRNAAGEVVTTEEHLRLHNVNESHGGNYTCTATNSQGSASFSILVTITSTCKSNLCALK